MPSRRQKRWLLLRRLPTSRLHLKCDEHRYISVNPNPSGNLNTQVNGKWTTSVKALTRRSNSPRDKAWNLLRKRECFQGEWSPSKGNPSKDKIGSLHLSIAANWERPGFHPFPPFVLRINDESIWRSLWEENLTYHVNKASPDSEQWPIQDSPSCLLW